MKEDGIDPEVMQDYVDGFRWGCPPVSFFTTLTVFHSY